jgi:hypothetical protein
MRITGMEEIAEKLLVLVARHYRVISPVDICKTKSLSSRQNPDFLPRTGLATAIGGGNMKK